MTATLADPRLHAWTQRKAAIEKAALLRMYRASMCGCSRCDDADRIEELDALIARAVEAIDELTEVCATRPVLVSG